MLSDTRGDRRVRKKCSEHRDTSEWKMCYKHTHRKCYVGISKCKHGWHITKKDFDALNTIEATAPGTLTPSEYQEIVRQHQGRDIMSSEQSTASISTDTESSDDKRTR